ncbi:MAG: tyrosine-type recombinase/integrase [Steroidobacteraceae bacterium]
MHAKLSQAIAEKCEPSGREYEVFDTLIPGFVLRVRRSGVRVWTYRYRNSEGRQRRYVIGRFPGVGASTARRLVLTLAADVSAGADVQAQKRASRLEGERKRYNTLGTFLSEQYAPWAQVHLKTAKFQIARIEADFAGWMNKPLSDLNTWLIESWRRGQSEEGKKPKTINRDVQRLQALLSKAVDWGVLDRHPFHGLKPLKTDRTGRVRYLSVEEEASLREALSRRDESLRLARIRFNEWRAARHRRPLPLRGEPYADHLHPVVVVAMNTGLRRSELFHLRWEDIDLDARWLTVHGGTAKNGQTRRIPLNTEAHSTLQAWRKLAKEGEPRVFPGVGGDRLKRVDRAWRGLRKRAQLQNFRFHDLRHHFASRLVQSGVPLNTVRELLGHADTTMVLRYAHLSPDHLADAVEKIARPGRASVAPVAQGNAKDTQESRDSASERMHILALGSQLT